MSELHDQLHTRELHARFRPMNAQVLIRRDAPETVSAGGIVIPDTAQKKTEQGVVIAVGPGAVARFDGHRIPMLVVPGDKVLFRDYAGLGKRNPNLGDPLLDVLEEEDILAIVED